MSINLSAATCAALALCLTSAPSHGELSKAERKEVKKTLKGGTLYMRVDAPCITGRHDFGTYKKPLVEISPEATETSEGAELNIGFFNTDSTYWAIRINDPVEFDEMDYDEDEATIEIELEGVDAAEDESTVIKLVDIHTLEDFHKAFDLAFARKPLQEEHDDWSSEIKQAIAERKLMDGMSKRQVYYVTGTPEKVEKSEDGDDQVETWTLRTDRGLKTGFFMMRKKKVQTIPSQIRFENGTLVGIHKPGVGDLDLDS